MASPPDPFEAVRNERDPLRQAKLAGELISVYQQRGIELARLRRDAINRAAQERGISFSAIATELGLTRGRITQIRQTAPPSERAFFGVGPITLAVPLRSIPDRALPMISMEDSKAAEQLSQTLRDLNFQVEQFHIPPDGKWDPPDDAIAICGPKSSVVTARAIESDPYLAFGEIEPGKWAISERGSGETFESPLDDARSSGWVDVAYVGRLQLDGKRLFVIAGVHALGSVGAVHYLTNNLGSLYEQVGDKRFSMVVRSEHVDAEVASSELVYAPRVHD